MPCIYGQTVTYLDAWGGKSDKEKKLKILTCTSYGKLKVLPAPDVKLYFMLCSYQTGYWVKRQQLGYGNSDSGKFVPSSAHGHVWETRTQVTLSRYNSITVRAVEFGHILRVLLQNVHLHGTALSEASVADVTFIWLLSFRSKR